MPVKVTTAPMPVRVPTSAAASAAASKSSRCRRIGIHIGSTITSPHHAGRGTGSSSSRHRWKKGDLPGAGNRRIGRRVAAVDGGPDDFRVLERVGVLLATLCEPGDEIADRRYSCRRLDVLLRFADALAHPG